MANALNNPLITQLFDPNRVLPGSLSGLSNNVTVNEKYTIKDDNTFLFPGLVATRRGNNPYDVQSFNQMTPTPVEEDIVGVVGWIEYATMDDSNLIYTDLTRLPTQRRVPIIQFHQGYVYCWAGEAITQDIKVHVATTTTGTGLTRVLAGSIVTPTFAQPKVAVQQFVINPLSTTFNYEFGSLVPISILGVDR